MWERLEEGKVNREPGVEEVRQADTPRLGDEAEAVRISIEAERLGCSFDREARLVVSKDKLLGHLACGGPVRERDARRAIPDGCHNRHGSVWAQTDDNRSRCQILEMAPVSGRRHAVNRSRAEPRVTVSFRSEFESDAELALELGDLPELVHNDEVAVMVAAERAGHADEVAD